MHAAYVLNATAPDTAFFQVQIVIGGHNDTAYLNDVWVATARLDEAGEDVTWYRLRDAPFGPRSDVAYYFDILLQGVYLVGGQVGHACGLRELGVCSREVWFMKVAVNASTGAPSVAWTASSLPANVSARCGPAIRFSYTSLVVGGQLSYNDSTCSTPPVTVNEQWNVDFPSRSATRLPDAPFSPRRWSGGDAAVVSHAANARLLGGYRVVNVSTQARNGRVRLAGMELVADVWLCNGDGCWSVYYNGSLNGTMIPPTSVPLPTAFAPITAYVTGFGSLSFGGVLPRAAVEQWRATRPLVDRELDDVDWREVAVNVTMVSFRYADPNRGLRTPANTMAGRMQLPLTAVMDEDELNDPTSDYALGSEWAMSHGFVDSMFTSVTAGATLHQRPRAFADSPDNSSIDSWWTPMAASSAATRRPLLNFDLRRRDHRTATISQLLIGDAPSTQHQSTAVTWTSGGRSGSRYYNDVVMSMPLRCPPPTDPSYREALGPLLFGGERRLNSQWYAGLAAISMGVLAWCPTGYHLEPPSIDVYVTLVCQADGMWMDPAANTVRRCVRDDADGLNCTWPLVNLGLEYCQPALPIVSDVMVSYSYNGSTKTLPVTDGVVLSGLPPNYADPVRMRVGGTLFVEPVRIFIAGIPCQQVTLDAPQPLCYNSSVSSDVSHSHHVCDNASPWVSCVVPPLYGGYIALDVIILSGRAGLLAETAGDENDGLITITSAAPAITRLHSADCSQEQPLSLVDCPVNRTIALTICAASDSIQYDDVLEVVLGVVFVGNCQFDHAQRGEYCAQCFVQPQYGSLLPIVLLSTLGPRSTTAAYLSFAGCPAGMWLDKGAVLQNATNLCVACPAGWSTMGNGGQTQCTQCPAGTYSHAADPDCSPCQAGQHSASAGSTACSPCPLNSYANHTRQTGCQSCSLNDYIVYSTNHSHDRPIDGECVSCPAGAMCTISGNILSAAGQYLLIDQQAATVSGIRCSSSACMSAAELCPQADDSSDDSGSSNGEPHQDNQQQQPPQPQLISVSQLRVVNCCGTGRWPAYVNVSSFLLPNVSSPASSLPADLLDNNGVNVLCAHCLPGHSSVNGRCVACSSVQWGALCGVLLLALLLVYAVHRLPHDWTGSASLAIVAYFVQLSAMFKASSVLPQLFALVNLQLLGGHTISQSAAATTSDNTLTDAVESVCIAPLDDVGRIHLSFLSPLIALGLLALLALIQIAVRAALNATTRQDVDDSDDDVGASSSGSIAWRVYRLLFVPAQPRALQTMLASAGWAGDEASGSSQLLVAERSEPLIVDAQPLRCDVQQAAPWRSSVSVWRLYQRSLVRLILLSYSGLSLLVLSCLHWQAVGEYGWRLTDYPTVSPGSSEWSALLPGVVLTLIVVCCAPLVLLLFLWHQHRNGHIDAVKRKLQLPSVDATQLTAREQMLLQLTAMYRVQHWWMPAYVLVRRLLAAVLLVTVRSSSVWVWLTIAGYTQLVVHLRLQSYERAVDNDFESLTLLSLSLQTALLAAFPPPLAASVSAALVGTTTALIAAPLLIIVIHTIHRTYQRHRNAHQQEQRPQQN